MGLKTLNEAGKITKVEFAGNHLQFTNAEYYQLILPLLWATYNDLRTYNNK